jgi:hypothetical protein
VTNTHPFWSKRYSATCIPRMTKWSNYCPHKVQHRLRCVSLNKSNIQNWFAQEREDFVLNSQLRKNS